MEAGVRRRSRTWPAVRAWWAAASWPVLREQLRLADRKIVHPDQKKQEVSVGCLPGAVLARCPAPSPLTGSAGAPRVDGASRVPPRCTNRELSKPADPARRVGHSDAQALQRGWP